MSRRILVHFYLLTTVLLITGLAEAQQAKKVGKVGFLAVAFPSAIPGRVEAFRQGLRELGYVEGKTSPLSIAMLRGRWIGCLSS
jgi:putative ABC transport system substrate-binding protein